MKNFFLGLLKDIAFWTLTPILLIAIGVGLGWMGTTYAVPALGILGYIFIAVGVIWLALIWSGVTD